MKPLNPPLHQLERLPRTFYFGSNAYNYCRRSETIIGRGMMADVVLQAPAQVGDFLVDVPPLGKTYRVIQIIGEHLNYGEQDKALQRVQLGGYSHDKKEILNHE